MASKMVTKNDLDDFIRLHSEGYSCRKIAEMTGFGKTTVTNQLRKEGIDVGKRFPSETEIDEWVLAFSKGVSPRKLSKQYGFDDETIRSHLKKRGIKMNPVGGRLIHSHDQDVLWQEDYLSGMSEREIAEKYGASGTTVSARLRTMGTEMRKGYETNKQVTDALVSAFLQEYEQGLSSVETGDKHGFSSTTVLKYLKEAGVDTGPLIKEQDKSCISDRYQNGESPQTIAADYGITDQYVRMILKDRGIAIREPERGLVFSNDEIQEWVNRYNSGESLASIAFSVGVKSPDTIRKRLVDAGVSIREKVSSTASSWQEWAIFFYLSKAFPGEVVSNNTKVNTVKGARYPDVCLILGNGSKFAIEYDGEFWHDTPAHRASDKDKTALLRDSGYRVIRIIENTNDINKVSGDVIHCSIERDGNSVGIGFAICALLKLVKVGSVDVDLDRDTAEISTLYYEAKNRTKHGIEWAKLYTEEGLSSHVIAKRYGTTTTTVTSALKSLGVQIRHQPTSEQMLSRWVQQVDAGIPVQTIADESGVSKSTVYRALKREGISFDPHPKKPITATDEEWKRLYCEESVSMSAIARQYSVSIGTVSAHLKKMGVTTSS